MNAGAYRWERPLNVGVRWTFWLLLALIAALLAWAAVARVEVYALVGGSAATLTPPASVTAPLGGHITALYVQSFQHVRRGQALLRLDVVGSDAQDSALQLSVQRDLITQAVRDQAALQAALSQKERAAEQAGALYRLGSGSRQDAQNAQADLDVALANIQKVEAQLQSARAQYQQLSRRQEVVLSSPADGQLTGLADLHVGLTVLAGQSLAQVVVAGEPLIFKGQGLESDRPKLRLGAEVELAWNGYPRQKYGVTHGTLAAVAPISSGNPGSAAAYDLQVRLADTRIQGRPILPGMLAEARVISGRKTALALFWDWVRGANPWD
ncbi:efflux RND transporter periplasmic adaptor subunit [Deinococcus sp.]|uniref:efflux RND transporter periplasmic adaptor subunit n=1 Tax=Deinococcus sp. TaxID=47478 RepID=UPI003CC5953B